MFNADVFVKELQVSILEAAKDSSLEDVAEQILEFIPSVIYEAVRQEYGAKLAKMVRSNINIRYTVVRTSISFTITLNIDPFIEAYRNALAKIKAEAEEAEEEVSPEDQYRQLISKNTERKMRNARFMVSIKNAKNLNMDNRSLENQLTSNFRKSHGDFIINLPAELYYLKTVLEEAMIS